MTGEQLSIDDIGNVTICECGHAAIHHYKHGRCGMQIQGGGIDCSCVNLVVVGSSAGKSSETLGKPSIDADIAEPPLTGQLTIDDELGRVIPSRDTDPETSHAAAKEIRVKANSQRARLLKAFYYHDNLTGDGLTDDEAMTYAEGVNQLSCYWKRCSELRDGGYIEPTGETRIGSSGKARIVSRITEKGRNWIGQSDHA